MYICDKVATIFGTRSGWNQYHLIALKRTDQVLIFHLIPIPEYPEYKLPILYFAFPIYFPGLYQCSSSSRLVVTIQEKISPKRRVGVLVDESTEFFTCLCAA